MSDLRVHGAENGHVRATGIQRPWGHAVPPVVGLDFFVKRLSGSSPRGRARNAVRTSTVLGAPQRFDLSAPACSALPAAWRWWVGALQPADPPPRDQVFPVFCGSLRFRRSSVWDKLLVAGRLGQRVCVFYIVIGAPASAF